LEDTTIEDVLKTFESFYLKKDYQNALQTLQSHKSEIPAGLWNYNVGTVMAQEQRLSEARFHFLQAAKFGFETKELSQNKELVEDKLEISRLEKPQSTQDYLVKAALIAQDGLLTTVSLLILVIGLWVLRRKADFKKIILFLVLVLTPIALNFWISSWSKAVVKIAQPLNEGPSVIFGNVGEVPAGVLVITRNEGEWHQVLFPSRFQGWIKNNELLKLE
jgi:hypothetical protein